MILNDDLCMDLFAWFRVSFVVKNLPAGATPRVCFPHLSAKCERAKIKRGGQNLSSWGRNLSDHVLYGCGIFKPLVEGIDFVS